MLEPMHQHSPSQPSKTVTTEEQDPSQEKWLRDSRYKHPKGTLSILWLYSQVRGQRTIATRKTSLDIATCIATRKKRGNQWCKLRFSNLIFEIYI